MDLQRFADKHAAPEAIVLIPYNYVVLFEVRGIGRRHGRSRTKYSTVLPLLTMGSCRSQHSRPTGSSILAQESEGGGSNADIDTSPLGEGSVRPFSAFFSSQ